MPSRKKILIIQGHPEPGQPHLLTALTDAYAEAARSAGHAVRVICVGELDFPVLRSRAEWEGPPPAAIARAQADLTWANHLVVAYPLWLGTLPALLKAFLEQLLRPGYNAAATRGKGLPRPLRGKSVRILVTMGMPALIYRLYFGAHSLRSLKRNILGFLGARPIRATLIGNVEGKGAHRHERELEQLRRLGQKGL